MAYVQSLFSQSIDSKLVLFVVHLSNTLFFSDIFACIFIIALCLIVCGMTNFTLNEYDDDDDDDDDNDDVVTMPEQDFFHSHVIIPNPIPISSPKVTPILMGYGGNQNPM